MLQEFWFRAYRSWGSRFRVHAPVRFVLGVWALDLTRSQEVLTLGVCGLCRGSHSGVMWDCGMYRRKAPSRLVLMARIRAHPCLLRKPTVICCHSDPSSKLAKLREHGPQKRRTETGSRRVGSQCQECSSSLRGAAPGSERALYFGGPGYVVAVFNVPPPLNVTDLNSVQSGRK